MIYRLILLSLSSLDEFVLISENYFDTQFIFHK